MVDDRLAGRCGIYCGACMVYRAYKDGGELLIEVAEHFHVGPDKVVCEGCGGSAESMWKNCRGCEVTACLRERHISFCHQCEEFEAGGCDRYRRLEGIASQRGEDIRAAEKRFREGGLALWLEEQRREWRCACGQERHWYEEICRRCHAPLDIK